MKLFSRLILLGLVLLALPAFAAPPASVVAGRDYEEIPGGQPFAPLAGKIEVVEVFGYTCGHCARFEPLLHEWTSTLPGDVRFTPVPGAFGGHWDAWARAYYAAEAVGVATASHQAVFDALHRSHSLPASGVSADQLASFYAGFGVNPEVFKAALRGDVVQQRHAAARRFAIDAKVMGTPTLIVNGRYRVLGESFEDMLRITDALIARERAAGRR